MEQSVFEVVADVAASKSEPRGILMLAADRVRVVKRESASPGKMVAVLVVRKGGSHEKA